MLSLFDESVDVSTQTRRDVHVLGADEESPIASPQLPAEVQAEDEGGGEVGLEEGFGVRRCSTNRLEGGVSLDVKI